MPPSSLIFLVVIAIWVAYLLQHWLKRRDHLATARSVDRFSEAMRVLDRTKSLADTNLGQAPVRSYAVTPARPHRAQVLVKRAEPLMAAGSAPVERAASGLAAMTSSARTLAARMSGSVGGPGPGGASLHGGPAAKRAGTGAASDRSAVAGPASTAPLGSGRAVRTVLFVASVVALVLAGVGASVGLVGVKIVTIAVLASLASFVHLRRAVAREKAARARARRDHAVMERRSARQGAPSAGPRPSQPSARPGATPVVVRRADTGRPAAGSAVGAAAPSDPTGGTRSAAGTPARRSSAVFDGATYDTPAPVRASAPAPAEGSWEPVPVPRPTYTMKAKAVHAGPVLEDPMDEVDDVIDPYAASRASRGRRASG